MSKVACVLTDMFEDVEFTQPVNDLKKDGHEVTNIEWKAGKEVTGKQGETTVTIDTSIDDVNAEDFDALFIPGGFSPDQLRGDEKFVKFAKHFMDNDKPVFAICHGPQLLITAKTLEGRQATGFKSIQVDMEYAGATVKDQEVVVCHDQLVTSRQPDDIPAFNKEMTRILNK
ncbi:type 1 glutamine amidotransferase domain-containing protein [Salimicrobium sp. PL1-032A]|uniref:type 1 glutamine amidotransferase domain-containing protein n=1 Tax=Salimicrobium sp. PL1-032A TaxID=3095364 RepID=UPI0032612544